MANAKIAVIFNNTCLNIYIYILFAIYCGDHIGMWFNVIPTQADLRSCDLRPLGRLDRNLRNKVSHLGMEHPGAAGSGEVKILRGGAVVEAGAEAILNELGPK